MRKLSVVSIAVLACSMLGCGKKKPAPAAEPPKGIALRAGLVSQAIDGEGMHVRLLGLDPKGGLVDYGELGKTPPTVTNGRVTGLPAGKPMNAGDLALTSTASVVLIADADQPAKDALAAVRSLDKYCWGFAVTAGDRLGAANPKPCPSGPPAGPDEEQVQLFLMVEGKNVKFGLSRVNEVQSIPLHEDDVKKTLAGYKANPFFSSCSDAPIKLDGDKELAKDLPDDGTEESGGTGTAMAFDMGSGVGGCHVLIGFDDSSKIGDVVDFYQIAIATGFTAPHWVAKNELPKIDPAMARPPEPPAVEKPLPPELAAAKKKMEDAKATLLATIKDASKSASDIKQASVEAKEAEEAFKAAKKKAKEAAAPK